MELVPRGNVETIAQANHGDVREYWRHLHPFYVRRIMKLWGAFMDVESSAATLPPEPVLSTSFIDSHVFELGGLQFELYATPGGETTVALRVDAASTALFHWQSHGAVLRPRPEPIHVARRQDSQRDGIHPLGGQNPRTRALKRCSTVTTCFAALTADFAKVFAVVVAAVESRRPRPARRPPPARGVNSRCRDLGWRCRGRVWLRR